MVYTEDYGVVARSTCVLNLMTIDYKSEETCYFSFDFQEGLASSTIEESETALVIIKTDFPYDKVVGKLDARPTHTVLT